MKFARTLVRLVTGNAGTKFMALLLALVLYVFVDQQNQETLTISELTLRFVLDEENARHFLLLDDQIALTDLQIKGQRERVAPLARELNQAKLRRILITPRMLRIVRNGFRIPLSTKLLREAAILPPEVEIAGEIPRAEVEFAELARRRMTLAIKPDQEERLGVTGENLAYVPANGDVVEPRIVRDERTVEVVGPADAFRDDSERLLVLVPDFSEIFRNLRDPEPRMLAPVAGIDWAASGLGVAYLEHVRIDGTPAALFGDKLELSFGVRPHPKVETVDVEILFLGALPDGLDLDQYQFQGVSGGGQTLVSAHLERGRGPVRIERPRTMLPSDLERLKLAVDLAGAEVDGAELRVPAYLMTTPPDYNLLEQVRLVLQDSAFRLSYTRKS